MPAAPCRRPSLPVLLGAAVLVLAAAPASATVIQYTADLSGSHATPRNTSPGTGTVVVTIDDAAHTMRIVVTFQDLLGASDAAHIHGPTATPGSGSALAMTPTPSLPGFPLGVTSGSCDVTLDLTAAASYNPDFITVAGGTVAAAEAVLEQSLADGTALFNLHTTLYATGEITGFFGGATVPDAPASWSRVHALFR